MIWTGGGIPESRRAIELSKLLGVHILPSQVGFRCFEFFFCFSFSIYRRLKFFFFCSWLLWLWFDWWNLWHSCSFMLSLMQVVHGHSPFKTLLKRYMYQFSSILFNIKVSYSFAMLLLSNLVFTWVYLLKCNYYNDSQFIFNVCKLLYIFHCNDILSCFHHLM